MLQLQIDCIVTQKFRGAGIRTARCVGFAELLLQRNKLGNVAFCCQGHIARHAGCILLPLAGQFVNHDIAGQPPAVFRAAHNIHVDVPGVIGDRTQINPVVCGNRSNFIAVIAAGRGGDPIAHRGDMDVFDIIFCRQVRIACSQCRSALLDDTAAEGLHRKRCVFCIICNVAVYIHIAGLCIRIPNTDTAVFLADKSHADGFIGFQREGVGLGRAGFGRPGHPVGRIGPKRPPVSAFFTAAGDGAGISRHDIFKDCGKFRIVQSILCVKRAADEIAFA